MHSLLFSVVCHLYCRTNSCKEKGRMFIIYRKKLVAEAAHKNVYLKNWIDLKLPASFGQFEIGICNIYKCSIRSSEMRRNLDRITFELLGFMQNSRMSVLHRVVLVLCNSYCLVNGYRCDGFRHNRTRYSIGEGKTRTATVK